MESLTLQLFVNQKTLELLERQYPIPGDSLVSYFQLSRHSQEVASQWIH
jgi:hypothetical protein